MFMDQINLKMNTTRQEAHCSYCSSQHDYGWRIWGNVL